MVFNPVWRRNTPAKFEAEMTSATFRFADFAPRSHLIGCPLLTWTSISRLTTLTPVACLQAAINARPNEQMRVTPDEKLGDVLSHGGRHDVTINGWAHCCRQCLLVMIFEHQLWRNNLT